MDVYSGYNQIPMFISGRMNTSFMTEKANYKYSVMPLKLKNTSVTYQRMMNKVFYEEIGALKVYMDDMIVKYNQEKFHAQYL